MVFQRFIRFSSLDFPGMQDTNWNCKLKPALTGALVTQLMILHPSLFITLLICVITVAIFNAIGGMPMQKEIKRTQKMNELSIGARKAVELLLAWVYNLLIIHITR